MSICLMPFLQKKIQSIERGGVPGAGDEQLGRRWERVGRQHLLRETAAQRGGHAGGGRASGGHMAGRQAGGSHTGGRRRLEGGPPPCRGPPLSGDFLRAVATGVLFRCAGGWWQDPC
jgi:hypothetical protein